MSHGLAGSSDRTRITSLFRNSAQLALLSRLLHDFNRPRIRVAVYGVADGAEAVSLVVVFDAARTGQTLEIHGFDINTEYLAHARSFVFPANHFPNRTTPAPRYFEAVEDGWRLRAAWTTGLTYELGDVLQIDSAPVRDGYQLVMCQNVLISLPDRARASAVCNLARLVSVDGLLALGGGPLGEIHRLAGQQGLEPVLEDVEEIHEGWTTQRKFYENARRPYWALEPFDVRHPEGPARYCTIFRKAIPRQ